MITANEIRTKVKEAMEKEQMEKESREAHERNIQMAFEFANNVMNKNLISNDRKTTWLFHEDEWCFHGGKTLPTMEKCIPFDFIYTPTKAKRFGTIDGFYKAVSLSALKEYLEKHGYSVTLTKKTFVEESWSRKTEYFHSGYEMVISWEEEE